jgi:membrane protein
MNTTMRARFHGLCTMPAVQGACRWWSLLLEAGAKDKLFLRASALTYTTVLSIVPFLAVAFSVLKGFGFQNTDFIRDLLLRLAAEREQVVDHIITYINQTNVRTLGVLGVGLLFFTALSMISTIESALNTIWGVERGRSLGRKITDYLSATLIVPVLMVAAFSISATLQNNALVQSLLENAVLNVLYVALLKLTPYVMIWLVLLFIYMLLPNTRVRFGVALLGSMITALVWQLAQWTYINFQIGAAKYNAIYGSFAQLPLFLIWVYLSWVIVLLGAELCFVLQNRRVLEAEAKFAMVSPARKVRLSLHALLHIGRGFLKGAPPLSLDELAKSVHVPVLVLRPLLSALAQAGILVRAEDQEAETYVLGRSPALIRIKDVMDCFLRGESGEQPAPAHPLAALAEQELEAMDRLVADSGHNRAIEELLHEIDAREPAPGT